MRRRPRGAFAAAATMVALLTLTACTGAPEEPAPITDAAMGEDSGQSGIGDSDPSQLVPEECADAYLFAAGPADIAEITLMPADWPASPAGAILCLTSETMDGSSETASYATEAPIEDVFAHYEGALTGYEVYRSDGAETGTGYATLDGVGADVAFQIRETDGGFVLVFGAERGL